MRRRRLYRWLAVGIIVAVGGYLALDVIVLNYAEGKAAKQLVQGMSAEDASIDLGGVPFIWSFLSGHLSHAGGRVHGATAPGGLRVSLVTAAATDVSFSSGKIYRLMRSRFAQQAEIDATELLVTIELSQTDIEAHLRDKVAAVDRVVVSPAGVEVTFSTLERARGEGDKADESKADNAARFLPRLENGVLSLELVSLSRVPHVFREQALQVAELISLPKLPDGLRSCDVRLGKAVIVAEACGRDVSLKIGESAT